jgi:hypothetical protein
MCSICEIRPAHGIKTLKIMRTKTMLLSALLGTLGSVSLMAQSSNVYSLNAVGYINVTIPEGYSVISCPLISSPDNSLNTLFPASNTAFKGLKFYLWTNGAYAGAASYTTRWVSGGEEQLTPGTAGFIYNNPANGVGPITVTFVGQVPAGGTVPFYPGFNLVSSILPVDGLLNTNLMDFVGQYAGDKVYTYEGGVGYNPAYSTKLDGAWINVPNITNLASGFFYENATNQGYGFINTNWVESFSVGGN